MKRSIFSLLLSFSILFGAEELRFGVISTVSLSQMQESFAPLLQRLEEATGRKIVLHSGYDYADTIEKFAQGAYDLGYIGPAPYVEAMRLVPGSLWIAAALDSDKADDFCSAIVVKKGSAITSLHHLVGKRLAFGSPDSTLSYFVPRKMLIDQGIDGQLQRYDFLGRHDRVAAYVIMGKYDAGALKLDVAQSYAQYLEIIAKSEPMNDFLIVCKAGMDETLRMQIRAALLSIKEAAVLRPIKPSLSGFVLKSDHDYDRLRYIIESVEEVAIP